MTSIVTTIHKSRSLIPLALLTLSMKQKMLTMMVWITGRMKETTIRCSRVMESSPGRVRHKVSSTLNTTTSIHSRNPSIIIMDIHRQLHSTINLSMERVSDFGRRSNSMMFCSSCRVSVHVNVWNAQKTNRRLSGQQSQRSAHPSFPTKRWYPVVPDQKTSRQVLS